MTAVPRLQLLPAPGATSSAPAVAAAGKGEQPVKPVVATRVVQRDRPDYQAIPGTGREIEDRLITDRRIGDRPAGQARVGYNASHRHAGTAKSDLGTSGEAANGRLTAFSQLSSMPFMVQLLGQQQSGQRASGAPETTLSGHRDAALLGSDIYRKAGGEPEFLPETATFVRLAV